MYERLPEHLRDLVEAPPGDWTSESGRNDRHRAICSVVNYLVAHELDTDWLVNTEFSTGASDGRRRTGRSVARALETFDPALYGRVADDLDVHYRLLDLVTGSDGRSKVMRAIIETGIKKKTLTPAVSSHEPPIDGLSQRYVATILRDFEVDLADGLLEGVTEPRHAGQARLWHLNPEWDGTRSQSRPRACLECARRRRRCTHNGCGETSHISPRKRYENKLRTADQVREWISQQPVGTRFTTKLLHARLGIARQTAGKVLRQQFGEGDVYTGRKPREDKLGTLSRSERYWFNN